MESQFFQWGQLVIAGAQVLVHGVAVVVIHIGLWQMKVAGKRRDREIDEMAEAFRKQAEAADRRGEALARMLERRER
jgi:hypothetical protein